MRMYRFEFGKWIYIEFWKKRFAFMFFKTILDVRIRFLWTLHRLHWCIMWKASLSHHCCGHLISRWKSELLKAETFQRQKQELLRERHSSHEISRFPHFVLPKSTAFTWEAQDIIVVQFCAAFKKFQSNHSFSVTENTVASTKEE